MIKKMPEERLRFAEKRAPLGDDFQLGDLAALPAQWEVISASHTDRQSTLLIRAADPVTDPAWTVDQIGMEDLVLAYMSKAAIRPDRNRTLEVQR